MLELFGHPFSSYTWKALIAFYANATPFEFRSMEEGGPERAAFVRDASPQGKFPVLVDDGAIIFESTAIIEHLAIHHPGRAALIPSDPAAAVTVRMLDRVFDNYVMNVTTELVGEAIRLGGPPGPEIRARVDASLLRSYAWIDRWLAGYPQSDSISLIECAAAPALFYADWVCPIPPDCARLRDWRAHLLLLAPIKRCVDEARPYRHYFPLGAPDRD
jgi:glutathione S-transferase